MKIKRRKEEPDLTSSEVKLKTIIELIKDLPRSDYNRLRDGMDLIYSGYQKLLNSKTTNEKELGSIDEMSKLLENAQ